MDGLVARAAGIDDAWGEVKNEFGDRVADVLVFAGLGLSRYADARLAGVALALVLCVSYLGILGKAVGAGRVYGGLFGKGDRMIALAVFSLGLLISGSPINYNVYLGLALLATAVTLVQRLRIIHSRLHPRKK
jgi:phosphatidylglycerophosphate synthase